MMKCSLSCQTFPPVLSPRKNREGSWVERGLKTMWVLRMKGDHPRALCHEYVCLCLDFKMSFIKGLGKRESGLATDTANRPVWNPHEDVISHLPQGKQGSSLRKADSFPY